MTEQQIPKLVAGLVEHQKSFGGLSTEDAQWVIRNTHEAINLFVAAVGNRVKPVVARVIKRKLEVWKTISIGGIPKDELSRQVNRIIPMGDQTQLMVRKPDFPVSPTRSEVDLVILTPEELGFTRVISSEEILSSDLCDSWSRDNLDGQVIHLCEAEVAPQLFLLLNTDERECEFWVAHEPLPPVPPSITNCILGINKESGVTFRKLLPGTHWKPKTKFVFELRMLPPPPRPQPAS